MNEKNEDAVKQTVDLKYVGIKVLHTLGRYIKQPSTWKGISLLCLAGGLYVDPVQIEQLGAGLIALIGLIDTVIDEEKK